MKQAVVPGYSAVSDADVTQKTGKSWDVWFSILDRWAEPDSIHTDVVYYLAEQYGLSYWWAEAIATRYDEARGRKKPHRRRRSA